MDMKKTILSEKELHLLESLISEHGYIVTSEQIKEELGISQQSVRNLVTKLVRNGWLVRVKRGYFAIANLESHNFSNISPLVISQVLVPDSYVSLDFALNYHGFFDQLSNTVTAVTSSRAKIFQFQELRYKYVKANTRMMTGFKEVSIEGQHANVASLEKTLLDFLHFRKDIYTIDLLIEKLKETQDEINVQKIIGFSMVYPVTLRRRLGFLLDMTGIDSEELYLGLKGTPGFAKLTKKSDLFNAKWRLYYEDRFTQ